MQEPNIDFDEYGLARNNSEVRVEGSALLGEQADEVDPLVRAGPGRPGVEPAGQQNLAHEPVQLGDIAGNFLAVLLGCCLANRLGRHPQARQRRAQLVGGVGEQPLLIPSKANKL